jgi:hypothetical protein
MFVNERIDHMLNYIMRNHNSGGKDPTATLHTTAYQGHYREEG